MQSDEHVQRDVLEELRLDPTADASQSGVTARKGVLTLTGAVPRLAPPRSRICQRETYSLQWGSVVNPHPHAPPGALVQRARDPSCHAHPPLSVPVGPVHLEGELMIPHAAAGLVIFAHGSGSSRHSPRNQFVASALRKAGLATVLLDLFTQEEARADEVGGRLGLNVELLAHRLTCAVQWLDARGLLDGPVGLFGASVGAAAALIAAARHPDAVAAIVSRGGRPDLAGHALSAVVAPTLLIVGGADTAVVELNRQAYNRLRCPKELAIVPGATHLFEEPGALEDVADLAVAWFSRHLGWGVGPQPFLPGESHDHRSSVRAQRQNDSVR